MPTPLLIGSLPLAAGHVGSIAEPCVISVAPYVQGIPGF
jgi:hypothetical protein